MFSVVVLHRGTLVGCGRVVGDGGLNSYLQDIALLPEHQGRGLGTRIMHAIMGYLDRTPKPCAFVGLMAAQDVSAFYERFGFRVRPERAPGMHRRW